MMIFPRRSLLSLVAVSLAAAAAAHGQDQSVKPGINEKFLDPSLRPVEWVERFEREGREVYDNRETIVEKSGIKAGDVVADVGAGTGLFEPLLSEAVGPGGKVIAVDIAPAFLKRIQWIAVRNKLGNVTTHLGKPDSVDLPDHSVDKVFICDTYHHFEFPRKSLASIYRALRPGGEMVVIDFERIEGVSSDWIMGHVRAGKDVFTQEILDAGFEKIAEDDFLTENYMIRFRKVTAAGDDKKESAE